VKLLTRNELLQFSELELRATADCHGLEGLDELSGPQVLEALDAWLEDFRALAGEG
jgi:hypothetical protein